MKHLIKAAEELNEVLGIEPAISTERINAPALEKNLKTAASLIDWDMDEISEDTKAALSSIGVKVPNMKKETPEEIDLVSVVLNTNELKTLKSLVKEHAVFTPLRKKIAGMFNIEEVKEEMAKLLGVNAPILDDEEVEKPKKEVENPKTQTMYMDEILKQGGLWDDLKTTLTPVFEKLGTKAPTVSLIKSHARFRVQKDPSFFSPFKITEIGIK